MRLQGAGTTGRCWCRGVCSLTMCVQRGGQHPVEGVGGRQLRCDAQPVAERLRGRAVAVKHPAHELGLEPAGDRAAAHRPVRQRLQPGLRAVLTSV